MQFRELFNKVDEDLNGALDINEWADFLEKMNHAVPPVMGRKLFLTIDTNSDGAPSAPARLHSVFAGFPYKRSPSG
jgi:Ca2+-binding EF-hand superfamily protein